MYERILAAAAALWIVIFAPSPALGQQATFTRPTDTISVPGNTSIGSEITIEAFISAQASGVVFNEQLWAQEDKLLHYRTYSNTLHGAAYRGSGYAALSASVNWELCEWVHIAFVSEGDQERLYFDGALVASRTVNGTIKNSSSSAMAVGAFDARNEDLRAALIGSIDWLRVSDVARYSGTTITPPASQPASDAATLLLFHFDEAEGSNTVSDQGPNGWNGTPGVGIPGATAPALGSVITAVVPYCSAGSSASGCTATLSGSGVASASAASGFDLAATGVEGAKDGLFFFGTNGRQANAWGSGTSFQCVTPPVKRAGLLTAGGTSGACDGFFSQDLNTHWQLNPPKNPGAGALVQAQLWYRDPANTSNQTTSLSDAVEFAVCP